MRDLHEIPRKNVSLDTNPNRKTLENWMTGTTIADVNQVGQALIISFLFDSEDTREVGAFGGELHYYKNGQKYHIELLTWEEDLAVTDVEGTERDY